MGIVGTGRMAEAMAQEIASLADEGMELVAVAWTAAGASAFGERHALQRRHDSVETLCADPAVDAVYVATPHNRHHDDMLAAIAAGKAVLCEKAFTLDAPQAEAVFAAARRAGCFVMEALWTRFLPAIVALRELLAAGTLGEVRLITGGGAYLPQVGPDHYLLRRELGGGVLLDAGVYLVSLAQMILGEPRRIEAAGLVGGSGVDEQDALLLQYPTGATALLYVSLHARRSPDLEILGTRGRVRLEAPVFRLARLALWDEAGVATTRDYPIRGSGYGYQLLAVRDALRSGATQCEAMGWADTLAVMRCLDAVRRQLGVAFPGELNA
ncbi:MAG: Gfo/Idh/MocA family oxidoreductase [Steroidobacteraceae bacterium]